MGFDYSTSMAMPQGEAWQYLDANEELSRPKGTGTKYLVKRTN
jgi:hypothetical protein